MAARRGHNDSSAISGLLAPPKATFRRDFMRENIAHLAGLEEDAAAAREAAAAPAPAAFKMKRFEDVPSRVAAAAAAASVPAPPAVAVAPAAAAVAARRAAAAAAAASDDDAAEAAPVARYAFLHHKEEPAAALPARYVRPEVVPRKASVPKVTDAVPVRTKSARDFVHTNIRSAVEAGRPTSRPGTAGSTPEKHAEYGTVPEYLRARQAEWAAEAAVAAKKEAEKDVPPGMRLMPEDERLATLAMLDAGITETRDALSKFKLTVVVPSQQRRKAELEAKITQLEDAVRVFSRTRVFVKLDA